MACRLVTLSVSGDTPDDYVVFPARLVTNFDQYVHFLLSLPGCTMKRIISLYAKEECDVALGEMDYCNRNVTIIGSKDGCSSTTLVPLDAISKYIKDKTSACWKIQSQSFAETNSILIVKPRSPPAIRRTTGVVMAPLSDIVVESRVFKKIKFES